MLLLEPDWTVALRSSGAEGAAALAALRERLQRGLTFALSGRADIAHGDIEDFTQDALVRVLDRLDDFAGRSKFTTWAQAIAVNTAFAALRRKRWTETSLDALLEEGRDLAAALSAPAHDLGARDEREQVLTTLREIVASDLTERQQAAIGAQLRGRPVDEIVTLLGTTRGAFYKLVHDARHTLQQRLAARGIDAQVIRRAFASS